MGPAIAVSLILQDPNMAQECYLVAVYVLVRSIGSESVSVSPD